MSKLMSVTEKTSTTTDSRIGFETEGGGSWPKWDRFITLDGKKAHYIGNICGTCQFIFERKEGANSKVSPAAMSESLRNGVSDVDGGIPSAAIEVFPSGIYKVMLLSFVPRLIVPSQEGDYFFEEQVHLWGIDSFWGMPHYAKNEYYRTAAAKISNKGGLFEFVVPMFPKNYLDAKTIRSYEAQEATPTALAVSVLDVKQPANWDGDPEVTEHWCLAHYLLDGHHKMFAASQAQKRITLLSFLAVDKGVSSTDQIAEMVAVLSKD
jgi:hypothetical protein